MAAALPTLPSLNIPTTSTQAPQLPSRRSILTSESSTTLRSMSSTSSTSSSASSSPSVSPKRAFSTGGSSTSPPRRQKSPRRRRVGGMPGLCLLVVLGVLLCLAAAAQIFMGEEIAKRVQKLALFDTFPPVWLSRVQGNFVVNNWVVPQWNQPWTNKHPDYKCQWTTFTSTSNHTAQMCVHPFEDRISQTIVEKGRLPECDVLTQLWQDHTHAHPQSAWSRLYNIQQEVYVEVGANIGACVMELLLSTNVPKIVAFEPHPMNQFALESTIRSLPVHLRDRVILVPVGLGASTDIMELFSAERNLGHSILGVKDKDMLPKTHHVPVERLDSILSSSKKAGTSTSFDGILQIPLLKLDAEGYECQVLAGMGPEIANSISTIKFQVDNNLLQAHECIDLFSRFRQYGFEIKPVGSKDVIKTGETTDIVATNGANYLAVRQGANKQHWWVRGRRHQNR